MSPLTKDQKQLLLANGFLAGLAHLGIDRLDSTHMHFEAPFRRAFQQWPHHLSPYMPAVTVEGTNQPRSILFRVGNSNSPFKDFATGINPRPYGLEPLEYLEDHCDELPSEAWVELARLFLEAKQPRERRS
ncbi:hypothetical protein [Arthrobacter sp. NPDC092385]|uniref:hypothetical protein n=1 Tax=Arthrobacter sp. NPDC092385 TaxID=3363943 RepID=UPI0037FC7E3A